MQQIRRRRVHLQKAVTIQSYNARLQMANNITLNGNYLFWREPFVFS